MSSPDTFDGSLVVRMIESGKDISLHSFGIAMDFNSATNDMLIFEDNLDVVMAIETLTGQSIKTINTLDEIKNADNLLENLADEKYVNKFISDYDNLSKIQESICGYRIGVAFSWNACCKG